MNLPITCVVIEDEREEREAILNILQKFPEVTVVGTAKGVNSGFQLITEKQPDAAFLDIKIMEGDAFMILDRLKNSGSKIPISIIITGYPEYAVQAFDYHSSILKYLRKPISQPSVFRDAIDAMLAEIRKRENRTNNHISNDHLFISQNGELIKVKYDEIFYIETGATGAGNIKIVLEDRKINLSMTLNTFLNTYPSPVFRKIKRQIAINVNKIERVNPDQIAYIFRNGKEERIDIGKTYYSGLVNFLKSQY